MRTVRRALLLLLLPALAAVAPPSATAHVGGQPTGEFKYGNAFAPAFTPAMKNLPDSKFEEGPCTETARQSMPVDEAHDHLDPNQHKFKCRMEQVAFDSLKETFGEQESLTLGEMDVKGNLAVIAIAYPESGFLLYDISDASKPKFLSHYQGSECEGVIVDVDCGAFVDLSPDLQRVYISEQQISVVPGGARPGIEPDPAIPGVEVVDISDPASPSPINPKVPVNSVGGVHTTRSFDVPEGPSSEEQPREPGSYAVSVANGVGATISKADPALGLTEVTTIELAELHDTFIQNDPQTGRTLLYIAAGFDTGFYVYDVTAPSEPKLLAEWDLTPECEQDWYSHTIDVTTRNGKRFVTMPVELIDFFGDQSEEDQAEGCGKLAGNGDLSGPLWIVETAPDFSNLNAGDPSGNSGDGAGDNADLKAKSEAALTATWSNAANRAGGELTFSPHNQQIVGDRIYLSGYHSGVTVLDASAAFRGENVRPKEVAIHVPHDPETRPIHPPRGGNTPAFAQFFTAFLEYRPLIWDMTYVNGHVIAADMVGGVYSLREVDEPATVPAPEENKPPAEENKPPAQPEQQGPPQINGIPPCKDTVAPTSRFTRVRLTRRAVSLRGTSAERGGCASTHKVKVAVGRQVGNKRCRFLTAKGTFSKVRRCNRPLYQAAKGSTNWTFSQRARLKRGSYLTFVRGTDSAGNRERFELRRNGKRTRIR